MAVKFIKGTAYLTDRDIDNYISDPQFHNTIYIYRMSNKQNTILEHTATVLLGMNSNKANNPMIIEDVNSIYHHFTSARTFNYTTARIVLKSEKNLLTGKTKKLSGKILTVSPYEGETYQNNIWYLNPNVEEAISKFVEYKKEQVERTKHTYENCKENYETMLKLERKLRGDIS